MKRASVRIALIAAAALALPAATAAAGTTETFGGKLEKGGKIGIDVTVSAGVATAVDEVRVKNIKAHCDVIGAALMNASTTFTPGLAVTDHKFAIDFGPDPDGNKINFKGTFRRNDNKVTGKIKQTVSFVGPDQDCESVRTDYSAKSGAPAPPKAAAARALRLAR